MSAATPSLRFVTSAGHSRDGAPWAALASDAERSLLESLDGPVLDIGCGPGRHVVALAEAGIPAMGIDVTPAVLHLARSRGAPVLTRSVFDRVPGAGRWKSALLLDGNLGIGADPVGLLERAASLVEPGGTILVEAGPPGSDPEPHLVRLECAGVSGPAFPWIDVSADRVPDLAAGAGLEPVSAAAHGSRWFARLRKPRDGVEPR